MCYLLAVTLRFVVAGLFSLVVTYCVRSLALVSVSDDLDSKRLLRDVTADIRVL